MANPNDGVTIAASWNALVNDKPEDNIFEDYWLLNRLKNGEGFKSIDGGDVITASLEYATNGTVAWYSDLETISTTRQDVFDRAEYSWKEIAGTVAHSELEAAINQGGAKKFDLLDGKLKNLRNSLDSTVNTALFSDGTGSSSKEIGGLQLIISTTPTTGTVGGINRANFSFWRNQQTAGTQTTSAFDNLRASMRSVYNLCSTGVRAMRSGNTCPRRRRRGTARRGSSSTWLCSKRFARAVSPARADRWNARQFSTSCASRRNRSRRRSRSSFGTKTSAASPQPKIHAMISETS